MALKALDIYKLLPKKNCKECGEPTCLTFAMKLAAGKADIEKCPYLDEEASRILGASTKPSIQRVKIGVGERSFAVGDEFVQFRHERHSITSPEYWWQSPISGPMTGSRMLSGRFVTGCLSGLERISGSTA